MPALRARGSRPSYAIMAEGLEDLSDEDGISKNGSDAEGSSRKKATRRKSSDSDSVASSGGSSAFKPKSKTNKPKGGSKGKGKGKAPADDSDSDFQAGSDDDEDDDEGLADEDMDAEEDDTKEEMGNEDNDDDDSLIALDDDDDGMMGKPKYSGPGKGSNTKAWTGPRSAQTAYVQTEANLIPPPYRQLIKKTAEVLAAPFRATNNLPPRDLKTRALEYELLPFGPTTPFVTKLRNAPTGRSTDEVFRDARSGHQEDWEKRKRSRQQRSIETIKHVTLIEPWQVWQGEGWWPEMATRDGDSSAGGGLNAVAGSSTGSPRRGNTIVKTDRSGSAGQYEWKMRDEVRLGLDDVGRHAYGQLQFLDEAAASKYLPQTSDGQRKPPITAHMGQYDKQTKVDWEICDSRPTSDFNDTQDGVVFAAGGPIWGLDWCPYPASEAANVQYLAVSTVPDIDYKPSMGLKVPSETPGSIQIWGMIPSETDGEGKVTKAASMKCELVLCLQGGPVTELKWMPMGAWDTDGDRSRIPKLGMIAARQLDGSISLYSVPHPRVLRQQHPSGPTDPPIFLEVKRPLLKLEVEDASCTAVEWLNAGRLICGTSSGCVVAWDVLEALKNPSLGTPLPAMYICISQSYIVSIAVGRVPPNDSSGAYDYTGDPISLVTSSYDGTAQYIELRDTNCVNEITSTRMSVMAVGWSSQLGVPIWADPDFLLQLHNEGHMNAARSHYFAFHRGPVWSISTSDYHTMVLSASTDGSVILTNLHSGWFRRRGAGMTYQRLFEMDYDIHTGEYRMIDNFAIEDISLDYANQKNLNKSKSSTHSLEGNPIVIKSGNWSPHVGVHRSCWNNNGGLGKAGWIASGTASGLGRVDILHGRFMKGKTPADV